MGTLNRLTRLGVLAFLIAAVAGCCVLPPRAWGHGQGGPGGHYQGR
jgi:hypothetical protein